MEPAPEINDVLRLPDFFSSIEELEKNLRRAEAESSFEVAYLEPYLFQIPMRRLTAVAGLTGDLEFLGQGDSALRQIFVEAGLGSEKSPVGDISLELRIKLKKKIGPNQPSFSYSELLALGLKL